MKTKFLWIEDNAYTDLVHLLGPVFVTGRYDAVIALDITEAVRQLNRAEFDAVIVDIRVPPGDSPEWRKLHEDPSGNKLDVRLGLRLLSCLFDPQERDDKLARKPPWLTPEKVGVLTVESEVERTGEDYLELSDYLQALNIQVYKRKTARSPVNLLLKMVDEIVGP